MPCFVAFFTKPCFILSQRVIRASTSQSFQFLKFHIIHLLHAPLLLMFSLFLLLLAQPLCIELVFFFVAEVGSTIHTPTLSSRVSMIMGSAQGTIVLHCSFWTTLVILVLTYNWTLVFEIKRGKFDCLATIGHKGQNM